MCTGTEDYARTANITTAFYILGSLQSAKMKSNTSQVGTKLRKRTKRELASSSDPSYPANHLLLLRKHKLPLASFFHCYSLSTTRSQLTNNSCGAQVLILPDGIYSGAFTNAQGQRGSTKEHPVTAISPAHSPSCLTPPAALPVLKGLGRRLTHLAVPSFCLKCQAKM